MKVTVIDYGLSNLLSVQHAFAHFGAEVQVTSSPADVLAADALVLPGVGAFQDGMQGLEIDFAYVSNKEDAAYWLKNGEKISKQAAASFASGINASK